MKKSKGWRFDFRGPNLFWQRGLDCIMSSPNADLIAVSLACSKDLKSPYYRMGTPRVSSVRTLLEKVGDLRTLQFWSNQLWHFLTFTDLHKTWSNCFGLSSTIFNWVFSFRLFKSFFDAKLFLRNSENTYYIQKLKIVSW